MNLAPSHRRLGVIVVLILALWFLSAGRPPHHGQGAFSRPYSLLMPSRSVLPFMPRPLANLLADLLMAEQLSRIGATLRARTPLPLDQWKPIWIRLVRLAPENGEIPLFAAHLFMTLSPESALAVLDAAMDERPDDWRLAELKGFILYHHLNRPRQAGFWYERAARLPGHPPFTASLAGTFYREGGRRRDAIRVLRDFVGSCQDPRLLALFRRSLEQVEAEEAAQTLGEPSESDPGRNRDGGDPAPVH